MPSVSEGPPCLLCGGETSLLYPSNVPNGDAIACSEVACTSPHLAIHDDIYICRPCGLGRSVPPVSSSELADLYRDVEDPDYFTSEEERRATFRKTLKAIERYPFTGPPGRLLEIGASVGLFLDEARECGWKAVGIEPSRWAAEQAQANGLDVFNGTLEEYRSNGLFDVVVSWDVWEHLTDPVGAVARVAELLAPGGLFCFTTVNMGGLGARLFRGLMIDSTGLRIHVGNARKPPKQRAWRKLHIAVDRETGNIVASELTASRARDATRVPALLTQIQAPLVSVAADSAYDKEAVYEAIEAHSPGRRTRVVIPPQRNATLSQNSNTAMQERDRHIRAIERHGRREWYKLSGYTKRSMVENAVYRYKAIIGPEMRARTLARQRVEHRIGCEILNKMAALGMPDTYCAG